jgi:hypothetical protein
MLSHIYELTIIFENNRKDKKSAQELFFPPFQEIPVFRLKDQSEAAIKQYRNKAIPKIQAWTGERTRSFSHSKQPEGMEIRQNAGRNEQRIG